MPLKLLRKVCLAGVGWAALALPLRAVTWFPLGPYGGDARSIVSDPNDSRHLYLGTATGWMYSSTDGGATWVRIAHIANRNDLVIDHIVVDARNSQRLIVGAFFAGSTTGGLYISNDAGKTWYAQAEMRDQSVRSLARSPSDPNELVAGTLQGVYRSTDDGIHWSLISPEGSTELHEVQSVAIDPVDPNVIYAGTWHLPWKTTDGGAHWENIKTGIIDDSDVFSIIVDPEKPQVVYASACSGIYKSEDGAVKFRKVQGIPTTARRTRKLTQDPEHLETVFAGTTEGLYRTMDGGSHWDRMTASDVVVNDVYVDPKNSSHVLIATDHGGVFSSEDGGVTFDASNNGFSARQVASFTADAVHASTIYVGVVNDKATGGVFQSVDGGVSWQQQSTGLGGRDVFSLASTAEGVLLAGTSHGVFRLQDGAWADSSGLPPPAEPAEPERVAPKPKPKTVKEKTPPKRTAAKAKPKVEPVAPAAITPPAPTRLDAVVYSLVATDHIVLAGTSNGLYRADAMGTVWYAVPALEMPETRFVAVQKSVLMAAGLKRIMLSMDDGATWDVVALPPDLTQIAAIALDDLNNMWVGGREGVYYSTDYGLNWKALRNLFVTQVDGIYSDPVEHRVLVTASNSSFAFAVHLPDYKVTYWDTGWDLRFVRPVSGHLVGATLYDGMVVQPRMVDTKFSEVKEPAKP